MTVRRADAKLCGMQTKKNILLIEDSPDLSFLYKKALGSLDCEVEICASGRSALEKLGQSTPNLIIMDLTLGDMSVEDFYSQFTALDGISQVPLVLISGREDLMSWADLFGVSFVAKKPVDMGRFRKAIQEILIFDENDSLESHAKSGSPTLV